MISDEEMQRLWARVLAAEANGPGRFSKRTINALGSLDKSDAEIFTKLCSFAWVIGGPMPLIYEFNNALYLGVGLNYLAFKHLNEIGLISLQTVNEFVQQKGLAGFIKESVPQSRAVSYYGKIFVLTFPQAEKYLLPVGYVLLSKTGQELASVCHPEPIPGFVEYVIEKWTSLGLQVVERS